MGLEILVGVVGIAGVVAVVVITGRGAPFSK